MDGLLVRPHSIASSPLGMLLTSKPRGSSNFAIWSAVSLSGSMQSAIRSAISLSLEPIILDRDRESYQNCSSRFAAFRRG